MKIIGGARVIDFSEDGKTCRVRLCDADGLPTGKVLTDVRVAASGELDAFANKHAPVFADVPDKELESAAWQNLYYNSHRPVDVSPVSVGACPQLKRTMNYLTLASMIRNEEHYVQEWLTFHYVQGFEQFVIVLHKCDDKTEERIKALPFADKIHVHKVVSDTQQAQMSVYVWIAENYGYTTEWLMFCDGDEYVCGNEVDDFREVLAKYEDFGGLYVNWLEFGHNGEMEHPEGLCIEAYMQCAPPDWRILGDKSIIKPKELLRPYAPANQNSPLNYSFLSPHLFKTVKPTVHTDFVPLSYQYFWHAERVCHDVARCNHYLYRSWEDWQVKHRRGNCNDAKTPYLYAELDLWKQGGNHSVTDTSVARFAGRVREVLGR